MTLVKSTLEQLRADRAAGMPKTARFSAYTEVQLDAVEDVLSLLAEAEARGDMELSGSGGGWRHITSALKLFDRVELATEIEGVPPRCRGTVVELPKPDRCMVEFFADADEQNTIVVRALDRHDVALFLPDDRRGGSRDWTRAVGRIPFAGRAVPSVAAASSWM